MTTRTLLAPDISCGHCKSSIEGAVRPIDGVASVEVHIADQTVDVTYDGTADTFAAIVTAIEDQGYEVAE